MKNLFTHFILVCLFVACKSKQVAVSTTQPNTTNTQALGKTKGVVSHKYKAMGCGTVVVINQNNQTIILIPHPAINSAFDVEGKTISFNFRRLRMPNPAGCTEGMPVELKDVE